MTTALRWIREDAPCWDADKQRVFGPAELAATGLTPPPAGAPVADEWWHVADESGEIVGYGWLDTEWGDAEVTFVVAAGHRGEGIGEFILDRLEAEAAARGLNYIYNVVPATSPNPGWVTAWLIERGFVTGDGDLRRRVREGAADPPRSARPPSKRLALSGLARARQGSPVIGRLSGLSRSRRS